MLIVMLPYKEINWKLVSRYRVIVSAFWRILICVTSVYVVKFNRKKDNPVGVANELKSF